MKVDGRAIARKIYSGLEEEIAVLLEKTITPHLVIVLVGSDPASKSYIRQKIKKAGEIGIQVTYKQFPKNTSEKTLLRFIQLQNTDPSVHGIIIQRPVPPHISSESVKTAVRAEKDVDGFSTGSRFDPPLALAVMDILDEIRRKTGVKDDFKQWLTSKNIVFIGRGEAGGKPVISHVEKLGIKHNIIHSKTPQPEEYLKKADIIVSAVGKERVVKPQNLKSGVILIGIGLHKEADGKLHGDYNENEIQAIASFYTPTPGGVGPVNVARLLSNVVNSAIAQS